MIKKSLQKIFKKISYEIFLKIYGKIEKSINCNEDRRIKVEKVKIDEELIYRIFHIFEGRLYTDRIHDTAALIDNKIIKEPSFQLRYKGPFIYNSEIENNIVFTKGTPRKLKKLNGSVLSLLTGGGGNENYWHWLFDVLPRLNLCGQTNNLNEIDYFLIPDDIKKFQNETLDCLKIPKHKRLSSKEFRHIKAKELIITDHPVVITGNDTQDTHNIPAWIIKWTRNAFLNQSTAINKEKKNKIYIDRGDTNNRSQSQRYILNEDEVKKYLSDNNFIFTKLHEISFKDQIDLFYNAECVVGIHGAGLSNVVFCKNGTKVIELQSTHAGPMYENLAKKNNLNYTSIAVKAEQSSPNQQGYIHIPIDNLKKILEN